MYNYLKDERRHWGHTSGCRNWTIKAQFKKATTGKAHIEHKSKKSPGLEAAALILTKRSLTMSLKEVIQIFWKKYIPSLATAVWTEDLLLGGFYQDVKGGCCDMSEVHIR